MRSFTVLAEIERIDEVGRPAALALWLRLRAVNRDSESERHDSDHDSDLAQHWHARESTQPSYNASHVVIAWPGSGLKKSAAGGIIPSLARLAAFGPSESPGLYY
jgi:hypothetical protein